MSSDDFSNSDVDDPIDEMFDYNNDGQLDSGERANENAYYANGGSFPKDIVNSTKKKILTVAVTFLLALATVLIWMAIVSVDPFKYLTISFEGAQPYLVPKAEVPKGAPAGIKASDLRRKGICTDSPEIE